METPLQSKNYSSRADLQKGMGFMLAAASSGALMITLQDLVTGMLATALASGAGLALQVCLYLFSSHTDHRVRWFAHGLLGMSVLVSAWYMEATWQQLLSENRIQQQQHASDQFLYKQQEQQLMNLNQQIEILLSSAAHDTGSTYRARGLNTLNELDELYKKRDHLLNALQQQNQLAVANLGVPVFLENNAVRLALFLFFAFMIDLGAIIALTPSPTAPVIESEDQTPSITPETSKPKSENKADPDERSVPKPKPKAVVPAMIPDAAPRSLQLVMDRIRDGDYGEFVPVKQIIEKESIRHAELKNGLDMLLKEGVINKVGNRYRHTAF